MLMRKEDLQMSLLLDLQKATPSNRSKMTRQVNFLMKLIDEIEFSFKEMNVMVTDEGHFNVGSFIECYLKAKYNGEMYPSYSAKGLKDLTLKYYDNEGKRHVKSFEVKTVLRNESSEVTANKLDLLVISYNGINYLSRKKYNEIKDNPDYFKKGTHRLNKNILQECEHFEMNNLHDLLMSDYFEKKANRKG